MEEVCRFCLCNSALMSLFPKKPAFFPSDATLAEKIMECVRCDIQENDNLPQKICIKCILYAETAFQFKRTCEQSQLILNTKVKVEVEEEENCDLDETLVFEKNVTDEDTISLNKTIEFETTANEEDTLRLNKTIEFETTVTEEDTLTLNNTIETGTSDIIPERAQESEQKNTLDEGRPEMTMTKEEYLLQMCLSNNKIPVKAAEKPDNTRRSQRLKIKKMRKENMGQATISHVKTAVKTIAKASAKKLKLATQVRLLSYIKESAEKQRVLRKQKGQH